LLLAKQVMRKSPKRARKSPAEDDPIKWFLDVHISLDYALIVGIP
jgi:hypothetical protein